MDRSGNRETASQRDYIGPSPPSTLCGSKSRTVKSQALWKNRPLKQLFLGQRYSRPEAGRVRQHVFGESQYPFYVQLSCDRIGQLELCEREFLSELIALPLVGGALDCSARSVTARDRMKTGIAVQAPSYWSYRRHPQNGFVL